MFMHEIIYVDHRYIIQRRRTHACQHKYIDGGWSETETRRINIKVHELCKAPVYTFFTELRVAFHNALCACAAAGCETGNFRYGEFHL